MKLGVVFPQGDSVDPAGIRQLAQSAEQIGYDHILCYDRQLGLNSETWPEFESPYGREAPFHEPLTLFAHLAGVTERIEFVSAVIVAPTRGTVVLAKQAAQIAVLSENRLRLGIGVGDNRVSFDQVGADFSTRGAYCEEQIHVLRELWTKPEVAFHGRWHMLRGVAISPRPENPIPIWLGGDSDAVIDRIGRLADGWLPYGVPDAANLARIERLRSITKDVGRDSDAIGIQADGSGTPAELREQADAWRAAGATHFAVYTMGKGLDAGGHVAAWREAFEALAAGAATR